jgi:hypothetical protein
MPPQPDAGEQLRSSNGACPGVVHVLAAPSLQTHDPCQRTTSPLLQAPQQRGPTRPPPCPAMSTNVPFRPVAPPRQSSLPQHPQAPQKYQTHTTSATQSSQTSHHSQPPRGTSLVMTTPNQAPGLRYPSNKKTIYDRNLNRSKNAELSRAAFAYLFIEMISYAQHHVRDIATLEKRFVPLPSHLSPLFVHEC